jgi:hypothetical protein
MIDVTFIKVQRIIVHELPTTNEDEGVLADALSPLSREVGLFFKERLLGALNIAGTPIIFVSGHSSPVPAAVGALLGPPVSDDAGFVKSSHGVARHLFSLKNKIHSAGLLCCISGTVRKMNAAVAIPFVALIKMEMQDGVRAHLKEDDGGKHYEIEVMNDLMLTKQTKVFKVAIFAGAPTVLDAMACDNQSGRGRIVADYFLDDFLGCKFTAQPDILTMNFLDGANAHFNANCQDPVTRSRYQSGLLAELNSTKSNVSLNGFANEHIEGPDRKAFLDAMTEIGLPRNFQKNIGRVSHRIRRIRWDFDGEVSVSAPHDAVEKKAIKLKTMKGGHTKLEIEAALKKVREAGR